MQVTWRRCGEVIFVLSTMVHAIAGSTKSKGTMDAINELLVRIDESAVPARVDKFWSSTGFAPPKNVSAQDHLLSEEVFTNLALIGSLPEGAITQVRIHWLLDLIKIRDSDDPWQSMDFEMLDRLIHQLWSYDLNPGFELMGNPSNFFSDFEDPIQVEVWRQTIAALASHLIERYGAAKLSEWNFETWNEPDHRDFGSGGLNFTLQGFLNYFDACAMGLRDAGGRGLRLGGPGGSCRPPHFTKFCFGLIQHFQNGTNYFTGRNSDIRLDFISFHKKGREDIETILADEVETIRSIHARYPKTRGVPMFNDEGDPMKSWWKQRSWHGDSKYPAFVTSNVIRTQKRLINSDREKMPLNFHLLSNDNAFLNVPPSAYFDQRTLTTRFDIQIQDGLASVGQFENFSLFLPKPIFNAMAVLSLVGDEQLEVVQSDGGSGHKNDGVDLLATGTFVSCPATVHGANLANGTHRSDCRQPRTISILMSNLGERSTRVKINLKPLLLRLPQYYRSNELKPKSFMYKITNTASNPRSLWQKMGSPEQPTVQQFAELLAESKLMRGEIKNLSDNKHSFKVKLPHPGVKLLQICFPNGEHNSVPSQPTRLRFRSQGDYGILITWRYKKSADCLKTFVIEYTEDIRTGAYRVLNQGDESIMNFIQVNHGFGVGWYRVNAVDVWDRKGAYSVPQKF